MLDTLHHIEGLLPDLLRSADGWRSLDVDYHPPRVERVYRDLDGVRVYLHVIHPCERSEALFHPHPWPSAMRVLAGRYEMGVGTGSGEMAPRAAATIVAEGPFEYEMVDPDGWHWVRPVGGPSLSVMVTGAPWGRWSPKSETPLQPLPIERTREILATFARHYPSAT